MKKNYANPIVQVIRFETESDILATSAPDSRMVDIPTDPEGRSNIWLD